MRVVHIQSANGDSGLKELSHPKLDQRIFRQLCDGSLEWAYESEWAKCGWRSRTYTSIMPASCITYANQQSPLPHADLLAQA